MKLFLLVYYNSIFLRMLWVPGASRNDPSGVNESRRKNDLILSSWNILYCLTCNVTFSYSTECLCKIWRVQWNFTFFTIKYKTRQQMGTSKFLTSPSASGPELILLIQKAFFLVWVLYTRITLKEEKKQNNCDLITYYATKSALHPQTVEEWFKHLFYLPVTAESSNILP